jgi:hypothetical protein
MTTQVRALIMKPVVFIGVIDNGTVANRTQSPAGEKLSRWSVSVKTRYGAVVPV